MADFPSVEASDYVFTLRPVTQNFSSPVTRSTQTGSLPGDLWTGSVTYSNKVNSEARSLKTFLMSLGGANGRFNFSPPDLDQQGETILPVIVNGAGQLGTTLDISGEADTLIFGIGDYMEVNGELKAVLEDVTTDGGGLATVTFQPPLRQIPPDAAVVEYEDPRVIMKLTNDEQVSFEVSSPVIYNATFALSEAF